MERHWWIVQLLFILTFGTHNTDASSLTVRQASRELTLVTTIFLDESTRSLLGRRIFHSHAALQFEAFGDEPPLRVQLGAGRVSKLRQGGLKGKLQGDNPLALAAIEMGPGWAEGDRAIANNLARTYTALGTVNYKNVDIMDPATGAGLMWDAWKSDIVYRSGRLAKGRKGTVNDCNSMARRMLDKMGVRLDKKTLRVFTDSEEYALRDTELVHQDVYIGFYQTVNANAKTGRTAFHLDGRPPVFDPYLPPEMQGYDFDDSPPVTSKPSDLEIGHGNPNDPEAGPSQGAGPSQDSGLVTESGLCLRHAPHLWSRGCVPSAVSFESEIVVASTRSRGALQTLRIVGSAAAEAIGIAATVAAFVFVIIDFVNHDWVGGSFALAGLIAGIAVAAAVSGPAGWVLAGAVTAFFAILPGAFEKAVNPPRISDTLQILRWATFGDANHAGDEVCKEQHPGANCTVVFGAGVMSLVFQWDSFDSIAFLIQYNDGYAMSMSDIAGAFQVIDSKNPNATAQAPAVIDCGTPRRMPSRWRLQQGNPVWCPEPKFTLRRNLVTLPIVNQTADQVYHRVTPNPGGDCVLINEAASTANLPGYNITIVGGQAAIACNITAGFSDSGMVVPIVNQGLPTDAQGTPTNASAILNMAANNLTNTSTSNFTALGNSSTPFWSVSSPSQGNNNTISAPQSSPTPPGKFSLGSTSTDGQAGHYIDPPPPSGFQTDYINATNAACMTGSNGHICLPNGTYSVQDGTLGFNSAQATSLALPPGGELSFDITTAGRNGRHPLQQHKSYTTNVTGGDFASSMQQLAVPSEEGTFDIHLPKDSAPALCLFTEPNFGGQVVCGGPGGGDVPDNIKKKSQSLSLHGGVTAWIYAQSYGDIGGERITTDVPNLASQTYGPDKGTFANQIVALWIVPP